MRGLIAFLASAVLSAACALHRAPPAAPASPPVLQSGIDLQYVDDSVRPQDDVYRHLNGKWLQTFQIPPDRSNYDSLAAISDAVQEQLRLIVETPPAAGDADAGKVADLYASFMDEARLESLGIQPLREEFAAIDAMQERGAIAPMIAHMIKIGVDAPYDTGVGQDARNSSVYAVTLAQSGLGLPDRDYYLKDDPRFKDVRVQYLAHIQRMFTLAGEQQAARGAADIVALETALARVQWTRVEDRDPVKTYNKTRLSDLPALAHGYDWAAYSTAAGIAGRVDYVIVRQPSYFAALGGLIASAPLATWKNYFKWRVLSASAPFLSREFVDERFAFAGTVLRGTPQNRPRWKRGIALIDASVGEALGRRYVDRYFPPESKARMQVLVRNLLEAYRRDIDTLDWMGPDTRKGAQDKLSKLALKIGYPDHWRDYGALRIARDDLRGNVVRANEFEYWREMDKLGKPIDRGEWHMTPQTVNAYYNPVGNEIVFPAAILQPPFFDPKADDAAIYGGIGAVIGHEISHGFDDKGSQYDGDGNLHDWFAAADHEKFAKKTHALVAQYDAYEVVDGYHVNGALTLGENIGDNSGLAIAYKAYHLALAGKPAPVIDGLTGDQRFYLGWVQGWRGKVRDEEAIQRIKTDPHSPPQVRGLAPLRNQAGFYDAFGVAPSDRMYMAPEDRVDIW